MNNINLSLFMLVSEVGVLLLSILCVIIFIAKRRSMRDKALASVLVNKIRNSEPSKREKLLSLLKDEYGYDDDKAEAKIDVLIDSEKRVYNNLIKIFLKKDRERISEFDGNLNKLIESYQDFGETGAGSKEPDGKSKDSKLVLVREENTNLRAANAKLKKDLDAAMQTMESMMSEYTSMYEGGKKDGEQRMKNEMFKLRQVLETKSDDIDAENTDINKEEK